MAKHFLKDENDCFIQCKYFLQRVNVIKVSSIFDLSSYFNDIIPRNYWLIPFRTEIPLSLMQECHVAMCIYMVECVHRLRNEMKKCFLHVIYILYNVKKR